MQPDEADVEASTAGEHETMYCRDLGATLVYERGRAERGVHRRQTAH
jgi:hypothetical protein